MLKLCQPIFTVHLRGMKGEEVKKGKLRKRQLELQSERERENMECQYVVAKYELSIAFLTDLCRPGCVGCPVRITLNK